MAAAFGAVAAVTLAIYGLREITPVVSTGVLYLLAVLLLSIRWGMWLGVATAVAGAVAFNFFHLPPTGRFTVASDGNWVALGVFLVAAVVASRLADRAQARAREAERRTREADALAGLAGALLAAADVEQARAVLAARLSEAFGLASASVELRAWPGTRARWTSRWTPTGSGWARCWCPGTPIPRCWPACAAWRRRWGRCWPWPAAARRWSPRWCTRGRCASRTRSRRRCCGRSRTTCARR